MALWRNRLILPILLLGVYCSLGCGGQDQGVRQWPYSVTLGAHRLDVEVARTDEEKAHGLMFREKLDETWGMLFVYDEEEVMSYWMENTLIPLSIAFIDKDLVVRDIQDMQPRTRDLHTSGGAENPIPVMYALEANQGWFAARGIAVGARAQFSPELKKLIGR
jgi:hypothetical protein